MVVLLALQYAAALLQAQAVLVTSQHLLQQEITAIIPA
jgi:hypothetical protein